MIKIVAVEDKKQRNQFVDLLYDINRSDKHWVPPLRITELDNIDTKNHPFYKNVEARFYLAKYGNRTVGRIGSIFNQNEGKGYFGFLQATKDPVVFNALFKQVEKDLSGYNCDIIYGPVNPSINYEMGVLVDGFGSPPFLMLAHNQRYYDEFIKAAGFDKVKDFYSYYATKDEVILPAKIARVKENIKAKFGIKIHNLNMTKFSEEVKKIEEVYNNAMESHWGSVPMGTQEFQHMANDLKQIVDPRMLFIAEINQEPVGFIMCLPNFNEIFARIKNGKLFPTGLLKLLYYKNKIKGLRVITLGVKRKLQPFGIGSVLYFYTIQNFLNSSYEEVEFSWVMEDNYPVIKISELIGAQRYKTYRLYRKKIKTKMSK
jgi:hypothetical protein